MDIQDLSKKPAHLGARVLDATRRHRAVFSNLSVGFAFALLTSGALLSACAADLKGGPEDYPGAYELPGTGGQPVVQAGTTSVGGGGTSQGGASGGTPAVVAGGPSSIPDDPACLATVLSGQSCNLCHSEASAESTGGGLSLSGSNLGQRLSMTTAKYKGVSDAAACDTGALIIDPNDPTRSVLLKKVKGMQSCGGPMPFAPGITDAAALKCIEDWIGSF